MPIAPVRVEASGPEGIVPALLFTPPDADGPLPLLLFGHGGHLSKDDEIMQILCRMLCRGVGAGLVVIDCPGHGERTPPGLTPEEFDVLVRGRINDPATAAQLVAEWKAIAAAARAADRRLTGATGYVGFSMGAVFGLSIVGELPDVSAAVFALGGVSEDAPARHRNRLVREGAAKLGDREVLMLNMTRDEHFPIAGALEVFEAIPGPKRMGVWHGGHVDIPPEAVEMAVTFLRRTLGEE